MSGSDVTGLQAFLAADSRIYPEGTVSGYYGALTEKAVKSFQQRHSLVTSGTPDTTGYGAVGPATRNLIATLCRTNGASGTPTSGVPGANCSSGGLAVTNGQTGDFYSVSTAPAGSTCASFKQTRQCINGNLSGNQTYQYASCVDGITPSGASGGNCVIDGETIANGSTHPFYSRTRLNAGEACSSFMQNRTCTNGVLSGSVNFTYLSCRVNTLDTCRVNGVTLTHGQSRTFYKYDTATSTNSCSAFGQTRTCNDGDLSGSNDYNRASCTAGACIADGITFANGSTTTMYFAKSIPATEQCASYATTRTCSNGTFSGNAAYKYASCAPAATGTCVVDSVVLSSGQSAAFYSTSTAAVGTACSAAMQTRTCTNGTLSGTATYNRASCSDTSTCSLDGLTVAHGQSQTFYSARTVNFGSTCSGVSQPRVCTNGKLSGGATYLYGSCTVNPPVSSLNTAQLAAALTALESLLKGALQTLNSWF